MTSFGFTITKRDKGTLARCGLISTHHGTVETPAFIPVGTQATVKSLTPLELSTLGVQIFFVNTYHVYLRPGIDVLKRIGGIHRFMGWEHPLISDSGGFQVFSLGRNRFRPEKFGQTHVGQAARVVADGVEFTSHWDGGKHQLTPEKAIEIQHVMGADIILAFDDCTPFPVSHDVAKVSLERTHNWAKRSLAMHEKLKINAPALYGVVQGSVFEDLRKLAARTIASMAFDGIAVGGVSVGESKEEMAGVLSWVIPYLPPEKPRHLLGVGEIDDIFTLVSLGIDTFDCVAPTRLARMGHVFQYQKSNTKNQKYTLDITKKRYAMDKNPIDTSCACMTCRSFSKAYIHHLFRVRELLAYRLATIHNIHVIMELMRSIRRAIGDGTFLALKKQWLYNRSVEL